MSALLSVSDLCIDVTGSDGPMRAVSDVSFDLAEGEVMGLVGESGSGKTLTCRSVLRLLPRKVAITGGRIELAGHRVTEMTERQLATVRGPVGAMIFQNPTAHLNPVMTIGNQIAEPVRIHEGASRAEARARARDLLVQVGIPDPDSRLDQYPHEFSGGMRQRAMIAAALACRPRLLIADEPTTALDVTVQAQILRLLLDLRDSLGLAIILVTHDLAVVSQTCEKVAVMYAGRIVESGPKPAVLGRPCHPYTEGLVASQPGGGVPGTLLKAIPGQPPGLSDRPPGCAFAPRCPIARSSCESAVPPLESAGPAHRTACPHWSELGAAA
ncbi:MAG: ABC transporter ATP-binding protein [Rubellimicrobium sp.]|nr:ABC transporter ATP-binding protein [Rubellimicrobium sp.]